MFPYVFKGIDEFSLSKKKNHVLCFESYVLFNLGLLRQEKKDYIRFASRTVP